MIERVHHADDSGYYVIMTGRIRGEGVTSCRRRCRSGEGVCRVLGSMSGMGHLR